ncbi:MAG: long-chain fatty acid--CoA ligase [Hyphomonadaceae bacterium]|nr:long-chain fatty acid--CoA ligase [Hyphomonadaceae bacterium]
MRDVVFDIAAARARLGPDRVALRDIARDVTLTYAALEARVARCAGLMVASGVGHGDRVGVLCRNRIAFFEVLLACARIGAVMVPLSWRAPVAELEGLLADSAPKLLFFGAEDAESAVQLSTKRRIGFDEDYEMRLRDATPAVARDFIPAEECWYLIYTSGTTGAPKGVVQTHRMAHANYVNIAQAIDLTGADVTLNFLPLYHTAGINLHTLPVLMAGGAVLVAPSFDAGTVLEVLKREKLTVMFAVPAVYQQLAMHPDFATSPLSQVRSWACGGAPLPDALVEAYRAHGIRVQNGMGMTETGPTAFLATPGNAWTKIGTVGRPQLLTAVRIVDADGADVQEGETGELLFAGPAVTPGYWNKPAETAAAFIDGVWLKSGDLARRDAEGDYFIVGRAKDMYISGGSNVYPAEVENVLADHPGVLEAAIVGEPDDRWGEVGCAYILPRPGQTLPSEAELTDFVRTRLAAYKTPKRFVFVTEFPRTAAGKVQKHKLKELAP